MPTADSLYILLYNKHMVKKAVPFVVIITLIILVSGAIFKSNNISNINVNTDKQNNFTETVSSTPTVTAQNDFQNNIREMDKPVDAMMYVFTGGSTVSYTAKKMLLNHEEAVVGVTEAVSGGGWYSPFEKTLYVGAFVDLSKMKTDSEKRDEDVLQLFTDTLATFIVDKANVSITPGNNFDLQIPGSLTINGVEKQVVFNVTGVLTDNEFNAKGETTVLMSDFGITPPSLANVFTAGDEVIINFTITGSRLN